MQPAERWNRHGTPLVAHPELELAVERGELSSWLRTVRSADLSQERAPSYPLDRVKEWLEARTGPFKLHLREPSGEYFFSLPLDHALGVEEETHVWVHERQLYVLGPAATTVASWLAPHEPINANRIVNVFREDLRVRNPFREDEYGSILHDARRYGLDLTRTLSAQCAAISKPPDIVRVLAHDPEREQRARAWLRDLANREWTLERHVRPTLPFWVSRAAAAPLIIVAPDPNCDLVVIASMGAGRVLQLRLRRFATSPPRSISAFGTHSTFEADGGDIHIWFTTLYDEMLEAESTARLRQENAALDDEEY